MQFLDAVTLGDLTVRDDGFLVADAYAARCGIQLYAGYELGEATDRVIAVYRSADEVFSHAALRTFSHAPLTLDHPSQPVNADNWKDLAVGETSAEVLRDGERLRIPLVVKDSAAIAAIRSGKRQLSVGYSCDVDFVDGTAPDGTPYQAVQRNIRANHIAIVDMARAGPDFKIGDAWGATPLTEDNMTTGSPTMRPLNIDGITIQFSDQGAEAVTKLLARIAQMTADNLKLNADITTRDTEIGTRDTEIGTLKVEVETLKKNVPDEKALERLAADRAALVEQALGIAKDLKCDGLTSAEIRRAAVLAAFGEEVVKDASDAVIDGMFKAAAIVKRDPVADALARSSRPHTATDRQTDMSGVSKSQEAYEKRLQDAWKPVKAA